MSEEKPVWEKCLCLMNEFYYDGHRDMCKICNLSPKEWRVVSLSNCPKMICVHLIIAIIYKHIHVEMELIQQSQSLQCLKPCSPLCNGLCSPLKKKTFISCLPNLSHNCITPPPQIFHQTAVNQSCCVASVMFFFLLWNHSLSLKFVMKIKSINIMGV